MGIQNALCRLVSDHLRKTFPKELFGLSVFMGIGSYIQQEVQDYRFNPLLLDLEHPDLLQNYCIRYGGFRLEGRREYYRTYLCNARAAWEQSLFGTPVEAKAVYAVIYYPTYLSLLVKSVIKPVWDILRNREDSSMQIQIQQITVRALADPESDYKR